MTKTTSDRKDRHDFKIRLDDNSSGLRLSTAAAGQRGNDCLPFRRSRRG